MEPLNRVALIVRPKRRYQEWADSVATGDDDPIFDLDEARLTPTVYLAAAPSEHDLEDLIDVCCRHLRGAARAMALSRGRRTASPTPLSRATHRRRVARSPSMDMVIWH
jgi:hypothetical protein